MTTHSLSVIVHGQHWPPPEWIRDLRAALSAPPAIGPASLLEMIEARERTGSAVGAAGVLQHAIRDAKGDLLLAIEAGTPWIMRTIEDLARAVAEADVLAVAVPAGVNASPGNDAPQPGAHWNNAWPPRSLSRRTPMLDTLITSAQVSLETWAERLHAARPRAWAIRRATLGDLGGLDADFWSVGLLEHLADVCAARGIATRVLDGIDAGDHDAWPLVAHLRQFLTIRNSLLSATLTLSAREAGRAFGAVSALALSDAWRQAAIASEPLRFGATWGAGPGLADRFVGSRRRAEPWPADETGCLLPVLALDAFLERLVERADEVGAARHLRITPSGVKETSRAEESLNGRDATRTPAAFDESSRPDRHEPPRPSGDSAHGLRDSPARASPAPGHTASPPFVSIIVVNWNGREHLDRCFSSLAASDYPADRLELLCVDNGSSDGSVEFLAQRFPRVRVIPLPENRGFTGGNGAGVAASRGDVLLFLNNDVRVEPGTIRALVSALDEEHPCAAAVVRDWGGRHIDFVRGSVNFEGRGFQEHFGEAWRPERVSADTFFPNGAAFAITREAFDAAGGFDDTFFAYYEDVDLGFGLRMNGGRVRVATDALVYHRHSATSGKYPRGQKRFLMERNALWTALKRYEDSTLDRAAGAILLLQARRIAQETLLRRTTPWAQALSAFSSRCRARPRAEPRRGATLLYEPAARRDEDRGAAASQAPRAEPGTGVLVRVALESLAAAGEALRGLPDLHARRRVAQARRRVSDGTVFRESERALAYSSPLVSYQIAQDALVDLLELDRVFRGRTRLLFITHEPLKEHMSGPGVRVLELGRALADAARVTVASPAPPEVAETRCTLAPYSADRPATLRRLAEQADTIVVQGFALTQFPFLAGMHVPIVVDLYCPFTLEFLEMKIGRLRAAGTSVPDIDLQIEAVSILEVQNAQLRHGDFFICASDRQRDFWAGALHTAGRVNALTYAADATANSLLAVVPFGVPDEDFAASAARAREPAGGRVMKGARPGIHPNDRIVFWGGSLLDWQDPLTLVRAVARIAESRDDVKLFFAGVRHPNPQVAPMRMVDATRTLARELGVLDRHVFLNDWIPYEQRAAYLQEADLGVSTHRLHLETHFSFRTRFLDYLWASLPVVCTEGDYFGDLVRRRGLGLAVPPGDHVALADAVTRLLDDEALRERCRVALREVREELRWSRVAEPLRRFAIAPRFAADHEPALRQIRARLRQGYRVSRWAKRTALRVGMSEARVEQLKGTLPVQIAMRIRNQIALARAGRVRNA